MFTDTSADRAWHVQTCPHVGCVASSKQEKAMVYACSSHQQGLQKAFSILAESDAGVHPATWSSEMAALKGKHSVELFEWKPA